MLIEDLAMKAVADGGMAARRRARRCGRWLRPRLRAVDRTAIGKRHFVRQLASRRKVRRNVAAIGCVETKVGGALVGVEHQDLFAEFITNEVKRGNEVRIAANEHNRVYGIRVGVAEHFCHDVYVGTFFLHFHHMDISIYGRGADPAVWVNGWNPDFVFVIVALDDFYASMRFDCLKINVLPFNGGCIIGIGLNTCCEVFYGNELVCFVKKRFCERLQIKPLATWPSAKKAEVKIATIDICYCFLHGQLKMLRSQTFRSGTPLRVGRTVRLDMNPLRGSVGIIPNLHAVRKGANFVANDLENESERNAA